MKKLLLITATLLNILSFNSCSSDNDEILVPTIDPEEERLPESDFARGNTLQFYFIDENNKDLIKKSDPTTFPIILQKDIKITEQAIIDSIKKVDLLYTQRQHLVSISYDEKEKLNYTNIALPGLKEKTSNQLYINVAKKSTDKIMIEFKFTDKSFEGFGLKTYASVKSLHYNDKLIYSETDKQKWSEKIFIIKKKDSTIVSFSRP